MSQEAEAVDPPESVTPDGLSEFAGFVTALSRAGAGELIGLPADEAGGIEKHLAEVEQGLEAGDDFATAMRRAERFAPPAYARLLDGWRRGGEPAALLQAASVAAGPSRLAPRRLAWSVAYPVSLAVLACLGLAVLGWTLLPVFERQYADMRVTPSPSVQRLQTVRWAAPLWALAVPVALVGGVVALGRLRPPARGRAGPRRGTLARSEQARRCHVAATLEDSGIAFEDALGAPVGPSEQAQSPPDTHAGDPPLVAWARSAAIQSPAEVSVESSAERPNKSPRRAILGGDQLRAIGDLYATYAERGFRRFGSLAPAIALVVLGGGATLLYALSVFKPLIELLARLPG